MDAFDELLSSGPQENKDGFDELFSDKATVNAPKFKASDLKKINPQVLTEIAKKSPVGKLYRPHVEGLPEFVKGVVRGATLGAVFKPEMPPENGTIGPDKTEFEKFGTRAGEFVGGAVPIVAAGTVAGALAPAGASALLAPAMTGMIYEGAKGAVQNQDPVSTAGDMATSALVFPALSKIGDAAGYIRKVFGEELGPRIGNWFLGTLPRIADKRSQSGKPDLFSDALKRTEIFGEGKMSGAITRKEAELRAEQELGRLQNQSKFFIEKNRLEEIPLSKTEPFNRAQPDAPFRGRASASAVIPEENLNRNMGPVGKEEIGVASTEVPPPDSLPDYSRMDIGKSRQFGMGGEVPGIQPAQQVYDTTASPYLGRGISKAKLGPRENFDTTLNDLIREYSRRPYDPEKIELLKKVRDSEQLPLKDWDVFKGILDDELRPLEHMQPYGALRHEAASIRTIGDRLRAQIAENYPELAENMSKQSLLLNILDSIRPLNRMDKSMSSLNAQNWIAAAAKFMAGNRGGSGTATALTRTLESPLPEAVQNTVGVAARKSLSDLIGQYSE